MKHVKLADVLKHNRVEIYGWTLQDAADRLGTSKGHLHDLESGESKNPRLSTVAKMCSVYNISPEIIIRLAETHK